VQDGLEYPLEGVAKLHGFLWGETEGVVIDPTVGVVDNDLGSAVMLGDHAQWAEAEIGEMLDQVVGEENPLPFLHHGDDFVLEECYVLRGGLVGSPGTGSRQFGLVPWWSGQRN
jgi:hypothetical protein